MVKIIHISDAMSLTDCGYSCSIRWGRWDFTKLFALWHYFESGMIAQTIPPTFLPNRGGISSSNEINPVELSDPSQSQSRFYFVQSFYFHAQFGEFPASKYKPSWNTGRGGNRRGRPCPIFDEKHNSWTHRMRATKMAGALKNARTNGRLSLALVS